MKTIRLTSRSTEGALHKQKRGMRQEYENRKTFQ